MKILFLDCSMGAAGDMLAGALLELLPDKEEFLAEMNAAGIPAVVISAKPAEKCGIMGTKFVVKVDGIEEGELHGHCHHHHEHEHDHCHEHPHPHHHHGSMREIEDIISNLKLPPDVKADALEVYKLIADAESKAHGVEVSEVHFHEVGTMDAIADIASVCLLMKKLAPSKVIASPVHTGFGKVHCAHGILPVPAPATATILKGIPSLAGNIEGELCTPTGAALLKHFVNEFAQMPAMRTEAIGYGMGTKDFEAANCLRAFLGEAEIGVKGDAQPSDSNPYKDEIYELSCNIDDMSGEEIVFAAERLFEAGALDVFTSPINMKKGRPGILLSILCKEDKKNEIVKAIFKHTSTLGIREAHCARYILKRDIEETETPSGVFRTKHSEGYGIRRSKLEYDDLARLAREKNISLREAKELAKK